MWSNLTASSSGYPDEPLRRQSHTAAPADAHPACYEGRGHSKIEPARSAFHAAEEVNKISKCCVEVMILFRPHGSQKQSE